jgi:hypothetical protein
MLVCDVHAQHGTARHGTARHGTARHGTARHGTAQHGTAQHGTARHSTAAARETSSRPLVGHARTQRPRASKLFMAASTLEMKQERSSSRVRTVFHAEQ